MRCILLILPLCFLFVSCQTGGNPDKDQLDSFSKDSLQAITETLPDEQAEVVQDDPERQDWQNPSLVIDKLGNLEGRTVADIGAGTGYFSFRMASEGAHVIAIDIDEEYLEYIEKRQDESLSSDVHRVETRLSQENDPLLTDSEADAVLIVNTYTYLTNRISYLGKVRNGMAPFGRIVIVDYKNAENPVMNATAGILSPEKVAEELEQAGFSDVEIDRNSLQYQYIITANK